MPIKGSLEEASTHDVLQLLALGRKTGCLSVTDWTSLGHIYVDSGRVVYATIVNRRDRLGDVLVRRGRITQEELDEAIRKQDLDRDKRVGEILLEMGAIDRQELERHMRLQVEEAVYFLLGWRQGSFTFEAGVQPPQQEFLISMDPASLMLEGARRTDEWPRIEQKVPSFGIVFKVDRERLASSEKTLTPEQRRVAPLLDGAHDVGEIVDQTGLSEFDVAKAVYGLVNAGLAAQVARRDSDRRLSASGVRVDLEDEPPAPATEPSSQHLSEDQMADYVAREGAYADAKRRREAAFHICDCVTCSALLKDLHRRSTAKHQAVPEPEPDDAGGERTARRSAERRTGIDRRQSTPDAVGVGKGRTTGAVVRGAAARPSGRERRTGIDRRESDRRARNTAPSLRPPKLAGAPTQQRLDRRTGKDRRSWVERRQGERRKGDRRHGTPVDRTDKFAVERRGRGERRQADRRTAARRATDRLLLPMGPGAPAATAQAGDRGATAAAAVAQRAPRRSGASERRLTRPKAPERTSKQQAPVPPDHRPHLRLTQDEQQSLAGLPLIEEPKLAKPGTPRTSFPPRSKPRAQAKEVTVEQRPAQAPREKHEEPAPVPADAQKGRTARRAWSRPAIIGAIAVVAVAVGWFGRPLLQARSGEAPGAVAEQEGGAALPAQTAEPTIAAAAELERGPDSTVTSPVESAEVPAEAPPPAEPTRQQTSRPEQQARQVTPPPVRPAPETEPAAPARLPTVTGTVRSTRSGAVLAGVRVSIEGTGLSTTTDASGSFEIVGVPEDTYTLRLSRDGYRSATEQVNPGEEPEVRLDLSLDSSPVAREPDTGLSSGEWVETDYAGAADVLGRPVTVVGGLWVESLSKPAEGARRIVRVSQLTQSGERVVLTVTAAGPAAAGAAQVTAIRVRPGSDANPISMGTASYGNLLVTARTLLPADSLRVQLQRLRETDDAEERQ